MTIRCPDHSGQCLCPDSPCLHVGLWNGNAPTSGVLKPVVQSWFYVSCFSILTLSSCVLVSIKCCYYAGETVSNLETGFKIA